MAIEAKIYPVLIPVSTHLEPVADNIWSSFKGVSTPVDIKNEIATIKSKLPIEIEAFFNFFESERSPLKEKIKVTNIVMITIATVKFTIGETDE